MHHIRATTWGQLMELLYEGAWMPTIQRFRPPFAFRGPELVMKLILCFLITSATFAQTSAPDQTAAWVQSDSSLRTQTTAQQYDFYYSAKQADQFIQMGTAGYTREDQIKKKRFRDRTFTEFVQKGRKPADGFDDYTLIGSVLLEDVKSVGEW